MFETTEIDFIAAAYE